MKQTLYLIFVLIIQQSFSQVEIKHTKKIGGRIIYDAAFYPKVDTNYLEDINTQHGFRQIRLYSKGRINNLFNYKLQLGFIKGEIIYRDVYLEYNKIPFIGSIKMGSYVNPYRLDVLNSALDMTFIERSFNDRLSPKWTMGIMFHNSILENDKLYYALSISGDTKNGLIDDVEKSMHFTSRLASLLYKKNKSFFLVDASYNYKKNKDKEWVYRAGLEFFMTEKFIATNTFKDIDNTKTFNVGFLAVKNKWSLQGEYTNVNVFKNSLSVEELNLAYGQVGYFLTKDSKKYKNIKSPLGAFVPNNLKKGAWEVAYRYDYLSIDAGNIIEQDHTFGLSWYVNKNLRITTNYILAIQNNKSVANLIGLRTHVRF